MADHEFPLSQTDAAELACALDDRSLDAVLGMLAAVSMPAVLPSQPWLGELMSKAEFVDVEAARRFSDLIMCLNNHVARSLMDGAPETFCPDPGDDRACRDFCDAHVHVVEHTDLDLDLERGRGRAGHRDAGRVHVPLRRRTRGGPRQQGRHVQEGRPRRAAGDRRLAARCVARTAEGRGAGYRARREVPKVGRNDPCPYGSGKKYKRCHGANP